MQRQVSDFGSRLGAAVLAQAARDAVIGPLPRSLTWVNTVIWTVWVTGRSVVVLGVVGSNPIAHPTVMSQDIEDTPNP